MPSTPFKIVSWSPNDAITDEKLMAMVNNDTYLRDTMVRGWYNSSGRSKTDGVKVACGLALITAGKQQVKARAVSFGNFFSDGCYPVVTTGIVSASQRQIYATIMGAGGGILPTRNGFTAYAKVAPTSKKKFITRNFYISWMAMGW